ncbi:DNA mismatch repair protein MutS [Sphingomonas sp. ABOLD]|uniref:DNA-nicking Smr family endonuclease n=1 Tax=Sphingomonas trueperi TaxID=53317 RepID=A0A7X5Y1V8_9SPHN|nr:MULTISPECIES: Smr/MutS family protein [Sphingomonas]NJB99562.1 DNA-nicking Smr family endonuclease [Sphingomonas trueperi]RSV37972.1 DNA mismatch repair protein MutS [Sphingomonas sp. ABOLE]RSV41094.1 DNA mismatch repair protein MutS [Sphingomonas sp. ABOLD]
MSGRGRRDLAPEEAALWQKVIASVTPLHVRTAPKRLAPEPAPAPVPQPVARPARAPLVIPIGKLTPTRPARPAITLSTPMPDTHERRTLDASWDRRLSRGLVAPESSIDLHGHNLHAAYDRLDAGLAQAIARGDRVLLLVTGKPPRPESERPHARGAIRAAVGDWLAASRHSDKIAAVRQAHPRHGGAGALYIVLRRPRSL